MIGKSSSRLEQNIELDGSKRAGNFLRAFFVRSCLVRQIFFREATEQEGSI